MSVNEQPSVLPDQEHLTFRTRALEHDLELLPHLPSESPLAWVRGGEGLIGWGVAARLQVRGDETFSRTQRWWNQLLANAHIEDTVSLPGTGPVAFASFAFDRDNLSEVVVPNVVVGKRGGQTWMTTIGSASSVLPPVSVPASPTTVRWAEGSIPPWEWEQSVATAVERITAGAT